MRQSAIKILKNAPEERFFFFAKAIHLFFNISTIASIIFVKLKKPFASFKISGYKKRLFIALLFQTAKKNASNFVYRSFNFLNHNNGPTKN